MSTEKKEKAEGEKGDVGGEREEVWGGGDKIKKIKTKSKMREESKCKTIK